MKKYHPRRSRSLGSSDIADQFPGVEIEFDDKVTLFPVQVEKDERTSRRRPLRAARK